MSRPQTGTRTRRTACAAALMLLAGYDVLKLSVVNDAGPIAAS